MMAVNGIRSRLLLLLCFISTAAGNMFAFTEEPSERVGKGDGYCSRILRAQSNRKDGNNEFRLRVEGDPETYHPGSTYRVTVMASSPSYFRGFTLIALREGTEGDNDSDYIGNFQIIDEEETQFMTNCPPAVTESTPRRRTSIQVFWTAPPSGSGCLSIKASIVQKRIIYFQDEGSLTKRMCEKESLYGDVTEKPLLNCCACGTAKYRVTFFGNWSEKSHPKDYPRRANHWSALIGASHSKDYVLWEYGGFSSDGVKQVAELGSPVKMEEEIRQKMVESALLKKPAGDDVLEEYKSENSLKHSTGRQLVNILASHMTEMHGRFPSHPFSQKGYEHFYDGEKNTGYLSWRLRTMSRKNRETGCASHSASSTRTEPPKISTHSASSA
ncbi:hypothetical protein KUCAC02_002720 [Chaenocephalus aceratus]|uniref:Uncharacterized protein n=1 Tax=Chaenocephalus aceratus TaxID=36190 RepID=A0ACB9XW40_CHAAC|nr:hypothetical protein KUCAC02_002720 [Chaenocephalus aceratus]